MSAFTATPINNNSNNAVATLILNVLMNNGMVDPLSDNLDSFEYKVIRSQWTPEDETMKFDHLTDADNNILPESEEERERVHQHLLSKEFFEPEIPRLVLVNFAEDRDFDLLPGTNQYPPLNHFSQKGMVINLETQEILCPGTSWMETINEMDDLKVLCADTMLGVRVQRPMEGASVSMFYYPEGKEIFIGTNKRVLKVSKIISGGGSRWNFYGSGAVDNTPGMFPLTSPDELKFDIHRGALSVLFNIALEYLGIVDFECEDQIQFINKALYDVFFAGNENVVYGGILSGKPFAGQSRSMEISDYDDLTFTLNSVIRRNFQPTSLKTIWVEEVYKTNQEDKTVYRNDTFEHLFEAFQAFSLDVSKFEVDPDDLVTHVLDNVWNTPLLGNADDVLFIHDIAQNGQRRIIRYQALESRFRDCVIRGGSAEELAEVSELFPRHRNRRFPTPANVRERVQQVITLSIRKFGNYAFQQVDVLGTPGAIELQRKVAQRIDGLMDVHLKDASRHWEDIAYPLSQFSLKPGQEASSYRFFRSEKNRKVCNGLAVLYACVSEGLKGVVVDEIARYFISRMLIAMTAFLPTRSLSLMESSFMRAINFQGDNLPIGIHKIRMICPDVNLKNSQRKYRIADTVANLSFLDVNFAMGFVNYPHKQKSYYTVPTASY